MKAGCGKAPIRVSACACSSRYAPRGFAVVSDGRIAAASLCAQPSLRFRRYCHVNASGQGNDFMKEILSSMLRPHN